jgi:hypothetical protein
MHIKISHRGCCIALITIGVHCAHASLPSGLRQALAEFETGATRPGICSGDYAVGSRKEISRFQILPSVWRDYSKSRAYQDPQTSWQVAAEILRDREEDFREATGREWDFVDIYLMWNAPGQYRRVKWDRAKLSPVVRARAERFANLFEKRAAIYASREVAQK